MARKLDIDNGGNTAWGDAHKSEMKDLFDLECFDIKSIQSGFFQEMTTRKHADNHL
jgi:hypothetical protein